MRHNVFGRKLSRTKNERKRLLEGLVRELTKYRKIQTTLAKAKAMRTQVAGATRIIRLGTRLGDSSERVLIELVEKPEVQKTEVQKPEAAKVERKKLQYEKR